MSLRPPPRPVSPVPLYDLCPACEAEHGDPGGLNGRTVNESAREFVAAWTAAVPSVVGWRFRCVRCLRIADEVGGA